MTHHDLSGASVWVLGASSGIGAATARELADRGANVVISARRAEELEKVSAGRLGTVTVDVADDASVREAWASVQALVGVPDIMLFCAGMWKQTPKATFSGEDFMAHVDVHLGGLSRVLDLAVPAFVERGSGVISTVASVAGYRGIPGGEYYGPMKAAQINLFEALRGSLAPARIDVVTICPGFVETPLTEGNSFPMPFRVSPERAAREICEGLEAGAPEVVFPRRMMVAMKAARLVPVRAWSAAVRRRDSGEE